MARPRNGGSQTGYSADQYGPQQRVAKKHSGAKHGSDKNGQVYTSGWNYSKRHGLVTFLCVPYKKSKRVTSARGIEWINVMVKIKKTMSANQIVSGMMDFHSGRVIIKDLGLVINPKAPNGGYCGTYNK